MSLIASRTTLSIWSSVTDLGPRVSPAITTLLVVASVSHAARIAQGSIPAFGPSRKKRSTISSEIRSQTLSGWPSETDSLVNKYSPVLIFSSLESSQDSPSDVALARDHIRFIVEPKSVVFPQHLLRRFQIPSAHHHFGQPLVFNLGDVGRIVPGCDKRRGSDGCSLRINLVW